jgi:cytochrome c6
MSNEEIIISVVTAVLVVFCLVVSVVIPRRDPSFPGRKNLVTFVIICLLLTGATLATIEMYGAEEVHGAAEAEVEPGEPAPGEGEAGPPGEGPPPVEGPPGDAAAGSTIYASQGCGACHTLADAGSTGAIGPNLDETVPPFDLVVDRVANGAGVMPAFPQLSDGEVTDVAAYVVAATSS